MIIFLVILNQGIKCPTTEKNGHKEESHTVLSKLEKGGSLFIDVMVRKQFHGNPLELGITRNCSIPYISS